MGNLYYGLEKKNIKDIDVNVLKHVFKLDDFEKVINFIETYCIHCNQEIYEKMIILYLKEALKRNKNNYFLERVLSNDVVLKCKDVMNFIFSKNFDLEHKNEYLFCRSVTLKNFLATHINDPEIMKKFLKKLEENENEDFSFKIRDFGFNNDLCRMNIIASNYKEALGYFLWDGYELFSLDNIRGRNFCSNTVYVASFNGLNDDILYRILNELSKKKNDYNNKDYKKLLTGILYSDKIKMFNIANLELIEKIDELEHKKFLLYLYGEVKKENIKLYSVSPSISSNIYYENIDDILKKSSDKVLKKVRKIED